MILVMETVLKRRLTACWSVLEVVMKIVLVLTFLLGVTFAAPRPGSQDDPSDGDGVEASPDPSTDELTGDVTGDSSDIDVAGDESGGLERAAVFGHYAHVYGAGKEGQDRKDADQAEQEAAQAAEEAAKSWRPPPGFPPQGGFPQGNFELPPGMFPGGFPPGGPGPNQGGHRPPNPNQGGQGPFQPNSNRGGPRPSSNPNQGGPFQPNSNRGGPRPSSNPPQGFPSPPPGWPQDWPFPPQMPQEGTPGSDNHMVPPPPPDPSMFEDMEFMNDPRGGMPAGFPSMMDPPGGYPPFMPPPPPSCPKVCDLTAYPDCTCLHPAAFTKDGRGNCNVGSLKPDLQVWCYINPDKGDPRNVCPDAKKSTTKKGYYWSRFACITE